MIFDGSMEVVAGAARRWEERSAKRNKQRGKPATEVEPRGRIQARLDRLSRAATSGVASAISPEAVLPPSEVLRAMGLERVIGQSDFQGIASLELALAVSRFVGRINIRSSASRNIGFGTGFMVSPRLLLTNNHVLPHEAIAQFSEVEFDYQNDRFGRPLPTVPFALRPDVFFMTDIGLDFSLVAVAEQSRIDTPVKHYGWSRLIGTQGKILIGEHLNIIQHPRGQFKQFVSRSNELVDLFDDYVHYVTDTEPGSSGSPVYNDQWEVVALHHSGVPKTVGGQYISKNGTPWDGGDPEDIEWVANEGIRVSSLVDHIARESLSGEKAILRDELLNLEPPNPIEAAKFANIPDSSGRQASQASLASKPSGATSRSSAVRVTVPVHITVELGDVSPETRVGKGDDESGERPREGAAQDRVPDDGGAPPPDIRAALAELERAPSRQYYNSRADEVARENYYKSVEAGSLSPAELYDSLSTLLEHTHSTPLRYAPATHVYPWVDLRRNDPPKLRSIYSGQEFDAQQLIEADGLIEVQRTRAREALLREASGMDRERALDVLEATLPYNCEHVVPQSWFAKREPMRGDLHHLFACEVKCNSFRSNSAYYDFPDFQEAVRDACGKSEAPGFEPFAGKGAVARATLYFLVRYPGEVGDNPREYGHHRLSTLLDWHKRYPVDEYERHRNAAIQEKQGNRNPLIDFPDWGEQIDFTRGLHTAARGRMPMSTNTTSGVAATEPRPTLESALRAIELLDTRNMARLETVQNAFGSYEGLPVQVEFLPDGRKVRLVNPLAFTGVDGHPWPVDAEVIVDGASIPRVFWTLIGGPFEGLYRDASIIHDRYCDLRSRSWRDTHRMFHSAMRCSGVGAGKARIMFYAVYRFGPRWVHGQGPGVEAFSASREPTDADAATILADAETIYSNNVSLEDIERLADARE